MADYGPRNAIVLPQMGMNTWVRSWVPHREIVGMAITHGECFGVSHALPVREGDAVEYRPTLLYAYRPCGESFLSLHDLRCRNYEMPPVRRILADDIRTGGDSIGALIMGHKYQSWWTGSILTIDVARRSVPNLNETAVQVAAGFSPASSGRFETRGKNCVSQKTFLMSRYSGPPSHISEILSRNRQTGPRAAPTALSFRRIRPRRQSGTTRGSSPTSFFGREQSGARLLWDSAVR
jgi:hypothetical protein